MNRKTAGVDDKQLENLFEQARRYPLLSADEEQAVDQQKWQSVTVVMRAVCASRSGRNYLLAVYRQALQAPPQVNMFPQREHHFILHRELSSWLKDLPNETTLRAQQESLMRGSVAQARLAGESLEWPGSLWMGIAARLLREHGADYACPVTDALQSWERVWSAQQHPRLTQTQMTHIEGALRQYNDAKETLILHNLRLVYSIAGRNSGKGVPLTDMIQEGTLGLMRAAEKFEADKGYRFSTYCFNWISQSIRRAVGNIGAVIRYPAHVREQVLKLHAVRENLTRLNGIVPSETTLARKAHMSLKKTQELRQLRNFSESLDAPIYDDSDLTLVDQMSSQDQASVSHAAELRSLQRMLLQEINQLNDNERRIVVARWGLHEGPALSRAELADSLSVSREWVRQLELSALSKLRDNHKIIELFTDYTQVT